MWFISDRRHREELAAARAEADRQRARATKAEKAEATAKFNRDQVLAQNAELDAANIRLTGHVQALGNRVLEAQVAAGFNPVAAKRMADRIARLQRGAARARQEAAETRRSTAAAEQQRLDAAAREPADGEWRGRARRAEKDVERLQKELDNACGMPPGGLLDSARWQPGYQAPTPDGQASAS